MFLRTFLLSALLISPWPHATAAPAAPCDCWRTSSGHHFTEYAKLDFADAGAPAAFARLFDIMHYARAQPFGGKDIQFDRANVAVAADVLQLRTVAGAALNRAAEIQLAHPVLFGSFRVHARVRRHPAPPRT